MKLDYGYGFERYGTYEDWTSGWNVTVNGRNLGSNGSMEKTYNLPKSLLLAEYKLGMIKKAEPDVRKLQMLNLCYTDHSVNSGNIRASSEYLQRTL